MGLIRRVLSAVVAEYRRQQAVDLRRQREEVAAARAEVTAEIAAKELATRPLPVSDYWSRMTDTKGLN